MDFSFKPSQKLLVCLTNGDIFEGVYQHGSKTRVDLSEISEHPSGTKIDGILSFYKNEIENIRVLESDGSNDEVNNEKVNGIREKDTILLQKAEFESLKEISRKYIYMATMDHRFFEALDYLITCETVGVFGIGSELGRQRSISILVLSSWDQVYLFDILCYKLPELHPKLKDLLETDLVKKVVHDSRTLTDCLYHCHKVKLANVFDTQVADLMISKREGTTLKRARDLSECLQHYFNFPRSILDKPLKTPAEKWTVRPIKDTRKIYAAQLGTYLITLKNLLERKLLQDYYDIVNQYSNYLKDMSLCDSAKNVTCTVPENISGLQ